VVVAGGGIKPDNARSFIEHTAAKEIHVGLRSAHPSPMLSRNPAVSMGSLEGQEYQRFGVLESEVKRLCEALAGRATD
jgi:copper homeostasis protein CutC